MFRRGGDSTLDRLTKEILREAKPKGRFDELFLSVTFDEGATYVSGFVFTGDDWDWSGVGKASGQTLDLFHELREEREDERGPFQGCLYRLAGGSTSPELTFLWGPEAEEWRIRPTNAKQIREKARAR